MENAMQVVIGCLGEKMRREVADKYLILYSALEKIVSVSDTQIMIQCQECNLDRNKAECRTLQLYLSSISDEFYQSNRKGERALVISLETPAWEEIKDENSFSATKW
ncbi:hypothetical protein SADUNF_Sadunf01G0187400 [Salix dunnii]|uniref:Uncharacterized protein n=1 Tax=Salix dunnii TaxID=1413687 RepID=A0A835TMG7_9ROSI|nr:hypothetical protein SADUNF_Sadunf01G0187400 [Salix dunnii]